MVWPLQNVGFKAQYHKNYSFTIYGWASDCSFSQAKHWRTISEHEEELDDFEPDSDMEVEEDSPNDLPPELPAGYFLVSKILSHKFDQGWKFLTAWEGFPLTSATWEPPKNFQLEGGRWNEVFEEYCKDNGIPFPPGRKKVLVCRSNENASPFFPQEKNAFPKKEGRARAETRKSKTLGHGFACSEEE